MFSKFKKLSLTIKYSLALGTIIILMGGVNAYNIYKLLSLKSGSDEISEFRMPINQNIAKLKNAKNEFRIYQLQHAVAKSLSEEKEYEGKLEGTEQRIAYLFAVINDKLKDRAGEREFLNKIQETWDNYRDKHKFFFKASIDSMKEEAVYILNYESLLIFKALDEQLADFEDLNINLTNQIAKKNSKIYIDSRNVITIISIITFIISLIFIRYMSKTMVTPLQKLDKAIQKITSGNSSVKIKINNEDEIGKLAQSLNKMATAINEMQNEGEISDWFKTGENILNERMRGDLDISTLSKNVITYLSKYLKAQIGAIYVWDENEKRLVLTAGYAFTVRKNIQTKIKIGDGYVGQAAYEKEMLLINDIPEDYISINSSLGYTPPKNIILTPLLYQEHLNGVIELGTLKNFSTRDIEFLKTISENIAISFYSAKSRAKINFLLEESRQKSEDMQKQQQELKASNEELEAQTAALLISETKLKEQQEELQSANEELEQKTISLEKQRNEISAKNKELVYARKDIEKKAKQLEITSKYKSEFLANMSHELRTPLNSLLILAKNFVDNKHGNLNKDQIEAASIIYNSGTDLLNLIKEILDLSKIEAGRMQLSIESVDIIQLKDKIEKTFRHMVRKKDLYLKIEIDPKLSKTIQTDRTRIEQVIKNLLSNAIKFTSRGGIKVNFYRPKKEEITKEGLNTYNSMSISVEDTGIGIPEETQMVIFEAFQQGDGSTSRKFGGTGLGLSISKEIAKMLNGEIKLKSKKGVGSTFTITIPIKAEGKKLETNIIRQTSLIQDTNIKTEKIIEIKNTTKTILIIEDDKNLASILHKQCNKKGFDCIFAQSGEDGIKLIKKHNPNGIIINAKLAEISAWEVIKYVNENSKISYTPIYIISSEEAEVDALKKGVVGFLTKPIKNKEAEKSFNKLEKLTNKDIKTILIIEADNILAPNIEKLLKTKDVEIVKSTTGEDAAKKIKEKNFDCIILDTLPDLNAFELLNKLNEEIGNKLPSTIIYTEKEKQITEDVKSEEKLLDEIAVFLNKVGHKVILDKEDNIMNMHDKYFNNKRILIVDDDMRNVFALSRILKDNGIQITIAEDGQKAVDILKKTKKKFDLILMDIMMPIKNGLETTKEIRQMKTHAKTSIIALTAKAMKEDREKCMKAGTNDYITKPVDIEKLLSVMKDWL